MCLCVCDSVFVCEGALCVRVCVCVRVRNVDGTPATSKRQPDVKAEGLVAQGPTVGGTLAVHWQCSHIVIIHAET